MFWCRMDQEFYRRHSMTELKDETGSSKTLSAAARRSFFRRKQKHKRSSSKDGKDVVALDAISTDSIPFLEGETLQYPIMQCSWTEHFDETDVNSVLFFWAGAQTVWAWPIRECRRLTACLPDQCWSSARWWIQLKTCWSRNLQGNSADVCLVHVY